MSLLNIYFKRFPYDKNLINEHVTELGISKLKSSSKESVQLKKGFPKRPKTFFNYKFVLFSVNQPTFQST